MSLDVNIKNRDALISSIKQEIIGPIITNEETMIPLNIENAVFDNIENSYQKYYNAKTNEEILQINPPLLQYSSGVLYPFTSENEELVLPEKDMGSSEDDSPLITKEGLKNIETLLKRSSEKSYEDNEGDKDLMPQKNDFSPASLALSFYVELLNDSFIEITVNGGVYKKFSTQLSSGKKLTDWWARELIQPEPVRLLKSEIDQDNSIKRLIAVSNLTLQLLIVSRKIKSNQYLITVSLTNQTSVDSKGLLDNFCLFQSGIAMKVDNSTDSKFLAYPSLAYDSENSSIEEELKSNSMLYRDAKTFALGHGCSANWLNNGDKIEKVYSTFLPEYEAISLTPDITDENGKSFSISMLDLAGESPNGESIETILFKLVESYERWIQLKQNEVSSLRKVYGSTPQNHLDKCKEAAGRMREGIDCIINDSNIRKAFKLANHAMAIQQVVGTKIRSGSIINNNVFFESNVNNYSIPEYKDFPESKGKWRAFQIAFFLLSIPSASNKNTLDRKIVDLIWFPTGGGKTEAYLGVAAFSMFLRRLRNKHDIGTDIIMRYTLRLLTTDQFQRSSRLICSMDMLRKSHIELLGEIPFSIGIWLGAKTTPNQNEGDYGAKGQLKSWLEGNDQKSFIVKSCPWCGAGLGKYPITNISHFQTGLASRKRNNSSTKKTQILGYEYKTKKKELEINCPDKHCPFHNELPIHIVDETIYEKRPTFILGTVDKFAMLSWKPKSRALFGLDSNGDRIYSPPNLIIQDELHLISGPLGSMTGMYEILVEELCTDYRSETPIKPKIICSTATIRRFEDQIQALYGRDKDLSRLFPSPGLSHDDSFFARVSREDDLSPSRGRKYIGVYSPTVGMQTLQVKIYSTLLQKVMEFDEDDRDPFWTLLSFFNSLRELGGALTLLQTDIPSYLNQIRKKHNITDKKLTRWLNGFLELTSRLDSGEVSDVIDKMKEGYGKNNIDVCLASSIIEVGVDIDRLSLITVVGQPKNTAQYIQVTGRIGRNWKERPGLVVSLYKAGISRDKSHFEHFREYHENLYAKVEPTSVTPFSDPCINRALFGLIIGYLRQTHPNDIAESPIHVNNYSDSLNRFKSIILNRVRIVDSKQLDVIEEAFDECVHRIENLGATNWEKKEDGGYFLMYQAGSHISQLFSSTARPVQMSMRSVDASCKGEVTNQYLVEEMEEHN